LSGSADPVECLEPKPQPEIKEPEPAPVTVEEETGKRDGNGIGKKLGKWWQGIANALNTEEEGADFSDDDE
ncbi:MAG: hypothetical protein K2H84_03480, partial [Paramuribaculum sp.]|nr:hypothetical protein [Paramuribaculum sp.]